MKKAGFIFVVLIALGLMGGLAFGQAKPIEWKMISTWTPAINLIEARQVLRQSGQRTERRPPSRSPSHPARELVPANTVFDTISKGLPQCGGDWPNYWAGKNTAFDLLGSYPMGLCQYDYVNWYYHAGGKKVFDNYVYGKYNMVYFTHCVTPDGIRDPRQRAHQDPRRLQGEEAPDVRQGPGTHPEEAGRLAGHAGRRRKSTRPSR